MGTTTIHGKLFRRSPFTHLETWELIRLALRIEHLLERSSEGVDRGALEPERYRDLVRSLRRNIENLGDTSRQLSEVDG